MTRKEYLDKLIVMMNDKLNELEPVLIERILDESGPECFNKYRRITESIFFWSWKDKDWRHEQMRMFGMNPNGKV